eukprot:4287998-Prorocentrum_lima.AAC.1
MTEAVVFVVGRAGLGNSVRGRRARAQAVYAAEHMGVLQESDVHFVVAACGLEPDVAFDANS